MKKKGLFGILLVFAFLGLSFSPPPDRADPNNWCFDNGQNCTYVWDGVVYCVANLKDMAEIE